MRYEKRTKGGRLWRKVTEAEARSLTGDAFEQLARGITQDTPMAYVRCVQDQPNLPGIGEGQGAYGRETP